MTTRKITLSGSPSSLAADIAILLACASIVGGALAFCFVALVPETETLEDCRAILSDRYDGSPREDPAELSSMCKAYGRGASDMLNGRILPRV